MHISDGVLPITVSAGCYLLSGGLAYWSCIKTKSEDLPKIAVMSSAFFVASMIHISFGVTSVHLLLPGLTGALLGRSSFLAIALGLLLQSLLFQFGGITALGANLLMMGIPALICGIIFHHFCQKIKTEKSDILFLHRLAFMGGIVGMSGTAMAATLLALFLVSAGENFFAVAKLVLLAHIPVIIIEGIVSYSTVAFLLRVKPELVLQSSQSGNSLL